MLLALGASAGSAQVPRAYLGDSNVVAQNVLRRLFDGIHLSAKQEEEATAIIKRTWREQFAPRSGTVAEQVKKGSDLNVARDSALKTLLKSESDQALFERNADALRARSTVPSRSSKPLAANRANAPVPEPLTTIPASRPIAPTNP